jgi:hypothetical protein
VSPVLLKHLRNVAKAYTLGYDSTYKKWSTEYDVYVAYQEALLRGEVERINLPGDNGNTEDDDEGDGKQNGKGKGKDDGGDESEEYFPEDSWPI